MKRVLVTGASGFIGRQTLQPLLRSGCEIHAVSLSPVEDVSGDVCWYSANLLKDSEINGLFSTVRPSNLLHLAWYAEPGKFWNAPENRQWAECGRAVMEAFYRNGGQRVVFAGTCAEYESGHAQCSENATPVNPSSLYGACKNELHQFAAEFAENHNVSMAWGRIFHLYGPYEHPQRFVPSLILALMRDVDACCTEGSQVRDFMQVTDVAAAFVALLLSDVTGSVNIASGQAVRVRDIGRFIAEHMGKPHLLKLGALPMPSGESPALTAAVERLQDEVKWTPALSLEQGLIETIGWWMDHY